MKYEVGQKVKIKSLDWYNRHTNGIEVDCGEYSFTSDMKEFCGQEKIIADVCEDCYFLLGIDDKFVFTDEMIEGLVEEETKPKYEDEVNEEYYSTPKYLVRPSGYQFVDENGNVINATKIVLEKKKKEYPKTYEECCKVLGIEGGRLMFNNSGITQYERELYIKMNNLSKLLICRDAYWKIAGEEMGLGKPWEPDFDGTFEDGTPIKYVIYNNGTRIVKERKSNPNYILAFPTEEMRDAFYENFKEEIEMCKELL